MPYFKNRHGQVFRSGSGGTYPVNDGNQENDDEDFDEEEFERQKAEHIDHQLTQEDQL